MSEYSSDLQTRFRLKEATFFYQQMEINFQDRTKFLYFLDAFLGSARSVTWVFKKEFHDDKSLMSWCESKENEWKYNKIMKFFIDMRDISQKEHTPEMRSIHTLSFTVNAILISKVSVRKVSPDGTVEQVEIPTPEPSKPSKEKEKTAQSNQGTVSYSFRELPKWFDEDPDVMHLCKKYLDELEKFVVAVENRVKNNE